MDFNSIQDPMVRDYLMKKYGTNKVDNAQQDVATADMVGVGVGAVDNLANAFNQPVALQNRMQDLGKAPSMIEGRQQKTDVSGLQKQAQMKLAQATSDEDNAVKMAFEQRKAELAAEAAAKARGEDLAFRDREFNYRAQNDEANRKAKAQEIANNNRLKELEIALKRDSLNQPKPQTTTSGKQVGIDNLDKKYAEEFNTFTSAGRVNAASSIKRLKEIQAELENEANSIFEAGGGPISGSMPDLVRTEKSISMRDDSRNAANASLKDIFGGALSDGERIAAANEFYNDKLGSANNAKRLKEKIEQLEASLLNQDAKAAYFQEHGTLKGFSGVNGASGSWDAPEMVTIIAPDGKPKKIPADQVEAALKAGGKRVK